MKKSRILIVIVLAIFLSASSLLAENVPIKKANYKLAARFSPDKIKKMVFSTSVSPHWLKHSDRFWYTFETPEGKSYYIVNPVRKSKMLLFDNVKMAAMLTMMTKDPYDAEHLPIEKIKFVKKDTAIQFEVESSQDEEKIKKEEKVEEEEKKEKEEEKAEKEKPKKKIFGFEYNIATGKLTMLKDYKKPEEKPKWASISPDGETILFARHHNLYWMDKVNYEKYLKNKKDPDIVEHQLTEDGEEYSAMDQGKEVKPT